VIRAFPSPGFYGSGLAWDGSHLWASNIADASHPETFWYRFYRIDPFSGAPVDSFATWPSFYHGIAWDGTHLWGEHNWDTLSRLTPEGAVVSDLDAPVFFTFGAAYDQAAGVLWVTAFQGQTAIYKLDPVTGEQLARLEPAESVTTHGWADLAWDGTHLWHTNVADDVVYKIEPASGAILDSFESPAPDCEGLTFDGTSLWLSSTTTDSIYQVESGLAGLAAPAAAPARELRVTAFPNPARGPIRFALDAPVAGTLELAVHDVAGRRVLFLVRETVAGSASIVGDGTRALPPGAYFFRARLGSLTTSGRVVVAR
jgi:hypothetical protein